MLLLYVNLSGYFSNILFRIFVSAILVAFSALNNVADKRCSLISL